MELEELKELMLAYKELAYDRKQLFEEMQNKMFEYRAKYENADEELDHYRRCFRGGYFKDLTIEEVAELAKKSFRLTKDLNEMRVENEVLRERLN